MRASLAQDQHMVAKHIACCKPKIRPATKTGPVAGSSWLSNGRVQLSRKLLSLRERLGCFSFLSALASIWRMRSRVTENCWPTSSSV